jgi:hypothetical protein
MYTSEDHFEHFVLYEQQSGSQHGATALSEVPALGLIA